MSLDQYRDGRRHPDWMIAIVTVGLVAFGLTMVLSASEYLAGTSGDVFVFVKKQLISFALGLMALLVISQIDYRRWRDWAGAIFIGLIILLLAVFISPECRGVNRCIDVGPVQFQPAEFVKLGFLVYLSAWLTALGPRIRDFQDGFLRFGVLLGVFGGMIMLQPDMGTTMTLIFSSVILFFLAGAALKHLGLGLVVGVGLALMMIVIAPYRLERAKTFLNPSADPTGIGYHTNQISIAIGSGGLWGLGFGEGKLKSLGYVPEVHTDSIFAVIVEELGYLRALLVLGAFLYLINRGLRVAKHAPDSFGRLLAAGVVSLLAVQASINLSAMLGLVPLTGIPLPLISYGGSSLMATMAGIGMLLAISRETQMGKVSKE